METSSEPNRVYFTSVFASVFDHEIQYGHSLNQGPGVL